MAVRPGRRYGVRGLSCFFVVLCRRSVDLLYATGGQIFTSEEVELPRDPVIAYLEGIDSKLGARYLEYLMQERKEESTHNGDRLAELYLKMTKDAKRKRDEGASCRFARLGSFRHRARILFWLMGCRSRIIETRKQVYDKFLEFIDKSQHYQVDRLFGHLPAEGLIRYLQYRSGLLRSPSGYIVHRFF